MKNRYLIAFILFLICISSTAQIEIEKKEKRIYLFDITASMEGKGVVKTPNIFSSVKKNLQYSIQQIKNKNTEVTIIPFTNKPKDCYTFPLDSIAAINQFIDNLKIEKGDTNISDAWLAAIQNIDSTKINYVFLLTDGLHNTGPEKNVLYEHIKNWQEIANNHYYFAFYIMLTPNAKEQELVQIIEQSDQIWPVESLDMNVIFIQSEKEITTNINNNNIISTEFKPSIEYDLKTLNYDISIEENPFYSIDNITYTDSIKHVVNFDIIEKRPRIEIPIEVPLKLSIIYDRDKYPLVFFTPEEIDIKIINKGIRKISITEIK